MQDISSFSSAGFPGINTILQIVAEYHLGFIILTLLLSHGFSFLWNYIGKGEYRNATLKNLMGKPYGRVVVFHANDHIRRIYINGAKISCCRSLASDFIKK